MPGDLAGPVASMAARSPAGPRSPPNGLAPCASGVTSRRGAPSVTVRIPSSFRPACFPDGSKSHARQGEPASHGRVTCAGHSARGGGQVRRQGTGALSSAAGAGPVRAGRTARRASCGARAGQDLQGGRCQQAEGADLLDGLVAAVSAGLVVQVTACGSWWCSPAGRAGRRSRARTSDDQPRLGVFLSGPTAPNSQRILATEFALDGGSR
jgi:hypothetical protein